MSVHLTVKEYKCHENITTNLFLYFPLWSKYRQQFVNHHLWNKHIKRNRTKTKKGRLFNVWGLWEWWLILVFSQWTWFKQEVGLNDLLCSFPTWKYLQFHFHFFYCYQTEMKTLLLFLEAGTNLIDYWWYNYSSCLWALIKIHSLVAGTHTEMRNEHHYVFHFLQGLDYLYN